MRQSRLIKNMEQIRSEKPVLFCFPFAGGGASAYSGWIKSLADEIAVCPVQLPGREERITEKPYTDIEELLDDLAEMIRPTLKNKVVFWGHSMGAKIAFALEKRLETENLGADQLIVSGSRVPCIPEPHPIYHLPDAQFITELGRFEGTPKEILANEALFHFFLPMLRADFTMDETYYSEAAVVLNCPIAAMGGTEDREATLKEILAWRAYTRGDFQYRMFEGGHFFIRERESEVLAEVKRVVGALGKNESFSVS